MPPTPLPTETTPEESTGSPVSLLSAFAEKLRLKVKRDEDGEPIIPGKRGHLYEHDAWTLGLMFMPGRRRSWTHARRKLEAAGFTIWQDGDDEGSALFDPNNKAQASLALKLILARPRRTPSETQLAALTKARQAAEASRIDKNRCAEGGLVGQKAPVAEGAA